MFSSLRTSVTLLLGVALFGCQPAIPDRSDWSGTLSLENGKSVPFRFTLDLSGHQPSAVFYNGDEASPVPEIHRTGDSLTFLFSEYQSAMSGVWNGREWQGQYARFRKDTTFNAFVARPIGAPATQSASAIPAVALAGTYRVFLSTMHGTDSSMIATFGFHADSVNGTLIAADGDYGLLTGTQHADHAVLTRFTGWQAFLLELDRNGTEWNGQLSGRNGPAQAIRLEPRAPEGASPVTERATAPKYKQQPFRFHGITPEGELVRSTDERFRGKAVLVDIMGTWCHNCMDAAPLLEQLSREFGPRGLIVVGLAFELKEDTALARRNLRFYAQRYGLTFPLLFCGSMNSPAVDDILRSQLENFYAYPTTLFLDPRGRVHAVHIGFAGPGTGDAYQRLVRQYYDEIGQILPRR